MATHSHTNLPPPLSNRLQSAYVLAAWAKDERNATTSQVAQLLACLNDEYLASRPRLSKSKPHPPNASGRQWRNMFYRNASKILGWGAERRVEGSGVGFSDAVYEELWICVWPDVEQDVDPRQPSLLMKSIVLSPMISGKRACTTLHHWPTNNEKEQRPATKVHYTFASNSTAGISCSDTISSSKKLTFVFFFFLVCLFCF